MQNHNFFLLLAITFLGIGCIGDDIIDDEVPERLVISRSIDSLQVGMTHQFEADFFNNVGILEDRPIQWSSTNTSLLSIDNNGLGTALVAGEVNVDAVVTLDNGETLKDQMSVVVTEEEVVDPPDTGGTSRTGVLQTTSSYTLEGTFVLEETDDGLVLSLGDDYKASSSLPGLYVYLTNNPNTLSNALELGPTEVFSGAHSYEVPAGTELTTYSYVLYFCKPFGVKVGDGAFDD